MQNIKVYKIKNRAHGQLGAGKIQHLIGWHLNNT